MGTVVHIILAVLCFLIAIRCLFVKLDPAPSDPPPPDAVDRGVYQFIFRKDPPPPPSSGKGLGPTGTRVVGFLLFTVLGLISVFTI